jgi:sialic acid synthase SpsE
MIAEIGLNHLGSEQRAWDMLRKVLQTEVDAVTFQIREPKFYSLSDQSHCPLTLEFYAAASKLTHDHGKSFGLALCDINLIEVILSEVKVDFWKTLSWDFANDSIKTKLISTGLPVYLSTGLSSMVEVVRESKNTPSAILIHTQLSQALSDVNLKAISTMAAQTKLPVAFGMHCEDMDVLKLALSFEPYAIFFYIKEQGLEGLFDDAHAIDISKLSIEMQRLRTLISSIGSGDKQAMQKPSWVVPNE